MKKIISLLIAAVMLIPAISAEPVDAKRQKQLQKECKAKTKELKKAGWQIFGSGHTLDGALQTHFNKLAELGDDAMEIYGTSTRVKSKNAGVQMAINNACISYAQQQGSDLKGRVISEVNADVNDTSVEMDKFFNAYERTVEKEIKGEMRPSYQLVRTNPDGTYEVEVYFIVSENAASAARIRALENTMKESEYAQRHAEKISEFVKGGFKN